MSLILPLFQVIVADALSSSLLLLVSIWVVVVTSVPGPCFMIPQLEAGEPCTKPERTV